MAKRNSSEMQTGNAEGQVRRPKKGASFVGGARPSGLWAVPAAVFFFIFGILPLFIVVGLSFFKWNGLGTPQFAGGQYWAQFIHDPKVMKSVGVTRTLTILGIVTQTPLSLLLGAWAAGRQRYRAVYTAIYFIPYLLSGTAIAVAWRAMLDPNFGMPSKMRWLFGDGNIFGNASSAIAVLVFVSLWQFTPFHALLYQGAVRAIPKTLYEAASIDGAGRIRQFFCITIPQVRNTLITSLLFQVVGGLTAFDAILVLTKGGPGTDTQNTAYYMYSTAFKAYNYGYSSVIAVVLIVIATILSLVMVKVSGYDKMRSELEGI